MSNSGDEGVRMQQNNKQRNNMTNKEFKVRISWKQVMVEVLETLKTNESAEVMIRSFSDYVGLRTAAAKHDLVVTKQGERAIVSKQRTALTVGVVGAKSELKRLMETTPRLEWTREMEEAKFAEMEKDFPDWYVPLRRRPTKEADTCSLERAIEATDSEGRFTQLGLGKGMGKPIEDDCFTLKMEGGYNILSGQLSSLSMAEFEFKTWEKSQSPEYLKQVRERIEERVSKFKNLHEAIDNALVNNEWFYAAMRMRYDKEFFKEWLEQNPGNARDFIELERPQQ